MTEPRGIESRIDWHLTHDPAGPGMCAQHTWHALGGNYGNPPAWGCPDANAVIAKVRASGRYWTPDSWDGPPPRGAWVGWQYGGNGHAALSNGDGRITTTDPANGAPTGTERLDYPTRWGFNPAHGDYTVWTDEYAGVRFPVATEGSDDMATYYCEIAQNTGQAIPPGGDDVNMQVERSDEHGWHSGAWPSISPHKYVQGNAAATVYVTGPAEIRLRTYSSEDKPMATVAAQTMHGPGWANVAGYCRLSDPHKLRLWINPLGDDAVTARNAVMSLYARD